MAVSFEIVDSELVTLSSSIGVTGVSSPVISCCDTAIAVLGVLCRGLSTGGSRSPGGVLGCEGARSTDRRAFPSVGVSLWSYLMYK